MASSSLDIGTFFLEAENKVPQYLKQLSKDLYEMYVKKVNTDMHLKTSDNKVISCHRAFLATRAPYFTEVASLLEEKEKSNHNLPSLDLKKVNIVMDYLYSGDLRLLPLQKMSLLSLYKLADIFDLNPMKHFLAPQVLPDKPPVEVKNLSFVWKIKNVKSSGLLTKNDWECPRPKWIKVGSDKFYVKTNLYGMSQNKNYLFVTFGRETDREIIHQISLDITILDSSKRRNFLRRLDYIFTENGICSLPMFVQRELIAKNKHIFLKDGSLIFDFTLEVRCYDSKSQAQETPKIFKITDRDKCSKALMEAYQLLSSDLLRLFRSQKLCDLTLLPDGEKLRAHRCIVAARSSAEIPLLKRVFKKFNLAEASSLLLFLYTGDFERLKEHAEDVHRIFSNFKLYKMKLFISDYLSKTLTVDNVLDRLVQSNLYFDEDLKTNAFEFIYLHKEAVMSSEKWDTFEHENVNVVTELANYMKGKEKNVGVA